MNRKKIQTVAGILLSFLFLWLALRKVDFYEVWMVLKGANFFYFSLAFFLSGAGFLLRAYRWKYMMGTFSDVRYGSAFSAITIGFMANAILPMRLGEVVRAFVVGYKDEIPKSTAFATIVIERIFDLFVLLLFFSAFILIKPLPPTVKRISLIVLFIGLAAVSFLVFMIFRPRFIVKLFNFLPEKISEKFKKTLYRFIEGLKVVKSFRSFAVILLLSFLLWSYIAIVNFTVFHAVGIELPLYAAFIVMTTVSLGISIPSAPGFVGTFHYFAVLGLSIFSIPKNTALSFAILSHLIGFLPVVLIGFVALQKLGLSLRNITES